MNATRMNARRSARRLRCSAGLIAGVTMFLALGPYQADAAPPLPLPVNARIDSMEGFRGAIIEVSGEQVQIDEIVWEILPDRTLAIRDFLGFDMSGKRVEFHRSVSEGDNASVVRTLADFAGFILRDAADSVLIEVSAITRGTDAEGRLTILAFDGIDLRTRSPVGYATERGRANCGLHETWGCNNVNCLNPSTCGDYPACPCLGTGTCSGFHNTECSGDCPQGQTCNGSVSDCKCVATPIPTVSQWGLIVLTLLLLTAGTLVIGWQRHRRTPAAAA